MFKDFKKEYIKGEGVSLYVRHAGLEGESINATHYMAEEIPEEIAKRMSEFFLHSIKS